MQRKSCQGEEARKTAIDAITTQQDNSVKAIADEGTKQTKAVNDAGTKKISEVNSAGETQTKDIAVAGKTAIDAITTQQDTSTKAVADEGTRQTNAAIKAVTTQQNNSVQAIADEASEQIKKIKDSLDKGLSEEGKAADAKATGDAINVLTEDLENKADYRVYTYGKTQSTSLLDTNNENKINIFSQDVFQFGKNMIAIPDREPETINGVTYYVRNNILHINGTCTTWTDNNIIATDIHFPEVLFGKSTTVSVKIVEGNIIESNGYPQWKAFGNFGSNFGVAYRQTKTLTSISNNNIVFAMSSGNAFNDVQVKFYLGFDKDYTDDFSDGYKKAVIGEISTIDGYLCKIDGGNFDYAESVSKTTVAYLKDVEKLHNVNILYGKKWVACGDSFTAGDFSTYTDINGNTEVNSDAYDKDWSMYKTYPYWIAKRNKMNLINEAIAGSKMYRSNKDSDFSYQRYLNVPTDADYITLQFGLNEDWNDSILGTISDTDNTTVMGAWNVVIEYFLTNIPYAKIGIIISDGWTSIKMRNALIEVARYWGVPYFDMCGDDKVPLGTGGRRETAGKLSEKAMKLRNDAYTVSATNSHPNVKAHQQRSTYIEQFLRSL